MKSLAPAIRLRRRQLDALALKLAAEQAEAVTIEQQRAALLVARAEERQQAALVPLAADAWFDNAARRLVNLAAAGSAANARLAALRRETVEARARLQLLEDAAASAALAARRKTEAKAAAALDDRIAASRTRR